MESIETICRKKNGRPSRSYYELAETIAQFDSVRTWLIRNCKMYVQPETLTNKSLATLCYQLLQFQEEQFGRSVRNPMLNKLPGKLFLDYRPNGALCHILAAAFRVKIEQAMIRFDFSPVRQSQNVEMFRQIAQELISQYLYVLPIVYIRPEIPNPLRERLREIVTKHHGKPTDSLSEATHVVHAPRPGTVDLNTSAVLLTDSDAQLFRPVMNSDSNLLFHFLYTPSSYDVWSNGDGGELKLKFEIEPEITPEFGCAWQVDARWLLLSDEFNEWCEEEDFLIANSGSVDSNRSTLSRRAYRLDELIHSTKRKQLSSHTTGELDNEVQSDSDNQSIFVVAPSYAAWFDYNSIHDIERRAFPEFFPTKMKLKKKEKKQKRAGNAETYKAYRNLIIDVYRSNPFEYLTLTTIRRHVAGELCLLYRIHAFLEQFGLINYSVDADQKPTSFGPPSTNSFHVFADPNTVTDLSSLQFYYPPRKEQFPTQYVVDFPDLDAKTKPANNGAGNPLQQELAALGRIGLPRGTKRPSRSVREWTDGETLRLLEAIEKHKDDWHRVAELVQTRTHDECITHFLRLPVEDPFLDIDAQELTTSSAAAGAGLANTDDQPVPFSQTANPVMTTIAFLASAVDPRVASVAARAAIDHYATLQDGLPSAGSNSTNADCSKPANFDDAVQTVAAAAALAAAGSKAKQLAQCEERKLKSLVALLIETQLKKIELKMHEYEELDSFVEKEREQVESQYQTLLRERQEFIGAQEAENSQLLPRLAHFPPHLSDDRNAAETGATNNP